MIAITAHLAIDENEIEETFIRSPGPGGQNVNKVATSVQLRFDAAHSPSLPDDVRVRLLRLAGQRATNDGVIVITARRFRTLERNRDDARDRLVELIRAATERPRPRRPTRPTRGSQERRLATKDKRGSVKRMRGRIGGGDS